MKRSHSRRDEDESEERYRKRKDDKCDDDHKESKHNGDHRSSTSYSHHDDYKSSGRVDEYWNPRRDDHRDRRYSDEREAPKDSDVEASGKRNSPREKIGSRYYYESAKPRKNPLDAKQKRTLNLLRKWIPRIQSGPYIPPAKLRTLQTEHFTDKSGAAYQRIAWEALKKFIHGCMNKVNTSNIEIISRQLLRKNLVRGRGMLAGSILQAQAASPTFTPVYAALTSIINSKFPNIGELVIKRLVVQFKRGFKWSDNPLCIGAATFIAHLVNQHVAHEIIALEILTLLLETPTDDSVEVAIAFLKECGMKLTEVSPRGVEATFEMLRNILTEGQLDKPVQDMTAMFQIKKNGFKDHEAVPEELDLVEEEDQITHLISLDDKMDVNIKAVSNVFFFDPDYLASEERYKRLRKEILGSDFSDSDSSDSDASDSESDDEDGEEEVAIIKVENARDNDAKANLAALRRTINLTINSSRNFEECAREVMKMHLKPGQETELCQMLLDCCAENRTYEKFFGRLAGQFCSINKMYVTIFEKIFRDSYTTIHRLDCNKLRNVAKFFGYLLFTDSISWSVLSFIQQNEKNASSSNRIFVKILFQELCEYMGLGKLKERIEDVDGQFPIDDPKNMHFVINFFTSIRRLYVGLGGLTNDCKLKKHLKSHPKPAAVIDLTVKEDESSSSDDDDDESSLTSIDSSSSCPSEDEDLAKKKKMQPKRKEEKSKSKKEDKSSRSVDDESSLSLIDSSSSWSSEDEDLAKKKKVQPKRKEEKSKSKKEDKEEEKSKKAQSKKENGKHKRKEEKSKSKKEDKEEEKSKKAQSKKENGKHKQKEEKSKSKKEDKEEEKSKKARSKKERGKTLYARIKRPIHVRARFACMGRGRFLER